MLAVALFVGVLVLRRFVSILDRYLLRETAMSTVAIALVLVAVLMAMRLARLLGQALAGDIPADLVFALIGLKALEKLAVLLPLAFFVALLMVFGRRSRDNEWVAMFAAGLSRWRLLGSLLLVALPFVVLQAGLVWGLSPWAVAKAQRLTLAAQSVADISGFSQGRFSESSDGSRVLYARSVDPDSGRMSGVFLFSRDPEDAASTSLFSRDPEDAASTSLVSARSAFVSQRPGSGERVLVMEDGTRYEGEPMRTAFRILDFERQGLALRPRALASEVSARGLSVGQLWDSPRLQDQAAFRWRLFAPLMLWVLAVIALAVGLSGPRSGRFARLPLGIVVYLVYVNLDSVVRVWSEQGSLGLWLSGWGLHALVASLAGLALWMGSWGGWGAWLRRVSALRLSRSAA